MWYRASVSRQACIFLCIAIAFPTYEYVRYRYWESLPSPKASAPAPSPPPTTQPAEEAPAE